MTFRSDFPRLAERVLAVGAEKRTECAELEPACIELTPFLLVCILTARLIIKILTSHIAVLDAETSYIHSPIWNTAYGIVKTGRNLCLHIFPSCGDVTAPCSCRISLQTGKSASCQQEYPLVRIDSALTVIDSIGIHDRIRIEELG